MFLRLLHAQKKYCVVLLPDLNAPWVNLLRQFSQDSFELAKPYDNRAFSITHPTGKRVPKMYPHAMIAVRLVF